MTAIAKQDKSLLPILIIGAGSCGLAIANGLQKSKIPYKVFEKDSSLNTRSARDWAVAMHWSAPILASLISEAKWLRIRETQVDPNLAVKEQDLTPVLNGSTGEVLTHLPFSNFYRLLRSRLRTLLAEGIDVAYNKRLSDIVYSEDGESVTAHFTDGASERGRLIIGADGSQSHVRSLLLGPERAQLKRLPFSATFINASYTKEKALLLRKQHPVFQAVFHPDNLAGMMATLDASNADAPETWKFTFYISRKSSIEEQDREAATMGIPERLKQAKELSKRYADPLRSAHEWLPDDLEEVYWGGLANWDPSKPEHEWDNHGGLVTLAGDAAHPMTYHRGQGLNHALDDAGKLVKLLSDTSSKSQFELIREFEMEMRTRSGEEVRLSEMNSFMVHDWSKLQQSPLFKKVLEKGNSESSLEGKKGE